MQGRMCSPFYIHFVLDNIAKFAQFEVKTLVAMVFWRNQRGSPTRVASRMFENPGRMS